MLLACCTGEVNDIFRILNSEVTACVANQFGRAEGHGALSEASLVLRPDETWMRSPEAERPPQNPRACSEVNTLLHLGCAHCPTHEGPAPGVLP